MNRNLLSVLALLGAFVSVSAGLSFKRTFSAQSFSGDFTCFPFFPNRRFPNEYKIVGGTGEITKSNHPQLVPVGFGKGWETEAGGYNPEKNQIMLVIRDRYINLVLEDDLIDNRSINFFATTTCGNVERHAQRVQDWLPPAGLFFNSIGSFEGTLVKRGEEIEGKFRSSTVFYLTFVEDLSDLEEGEEYDGVVVGKFTLNLERGRSSFPFPTSDR